MRDFCLTMVFWTLLSPLYAQEADCIDHTTGPQIVDDFSIEGCSECGDCGTEFHLPELTDPTVLIQHREDDTDGMLFGSISHNDIIEDLADVDYIDADQVIGLGEMVDANIDIAEFLDCININCRNNFFQLDEAGNYGDLIAGELEDIFSNTISDEDRTVICNAYPDLDCDNVISDLQSHNFDPDEINTQFEAEFTGHGCPVGDINCLIENLYGASNIPESINQCFPNGTPLQRGTEAKGSKNMSGFEVEGDLDIFSVRIPGTSTHSDNTPAPENFNAIRAVNQSVGLYNGGLNLEVPIHTLQANDITLPISLAKTGDGVKVDALGSEVGTNFMLEAGGAISRSVNNLPDEYLGTRQAGRGRGPGVVLKPCVTLNLGGTSFFARPKSVEWSALAPNVLKFNITYVTFLIPITPFLAIPVHLYFTIEVHLNVRTKPDYYTMTERGVGYFHIMNSEVLSTYTNGRVSFPINLFDFQA